MSALPDSMLVSAMTELGKAAIEERPLPAMRDDEVLVRVEAVGVCGSDTHFFIEGHIGDMKVECPFVLGHEFGGVVVAAGSAVSPERIGDRVAVEPHRPCGVCHYCKIGLYNLCPNVEFLAAPPVDGAFAQYITIRADMAHTLPDSISFEEAALLEPLSVGIWAAHKAQVGAGDRVLVAGAGPVGILAAQVAQAFGASEVIVSDISESRLEAAKKLGASRTILATDPELIDLGVDVFIDASGAAPAVVSGMRATRAAGRVVLVGMGAEELTIPLAVIQHRELTVVGVFRYANTWPTAIDLVTTNRVNLLPLVTDKFSLEQTAEALMAASRVPGSLKSMVYPNGIPTA